MTTPEPPAEVLADIRRKLESIRSTTSLGYQTGPYAYAGEDMGQYLRDATDDCRDILHSLSTLERSLAAGKVEPTAWRIHWSESEFGQPELTDDAERVAKVAALDTPPRIVPLYTAPPADPAKSSEPNEVRIDFPGIGHAGPFAVVNGEITLPATTMSDLAHHFRMGYVEKARGSAPDGCYVVRYNDDGEFGQYVGWLYRTGGDPCVISGKPVYVWRPLAELLEKAA